MSSKDTGNVPDKVLIEKRIEYLEERINSLEHKSRLDTFVILELLEYINSEKRVNNIGSSYSFIFKCKYCDCVIFDKIDRICEICENEESKI